MRQRAAPKHPYRDSALLYACLSVLVVVVAAVSGGNLTTAILVAAGVFVAATAWSWWRLRVRETRRTDT